MPLSAPIDRTRLPPHVERTLDAHARRRGAPHNELIAWTVAGWADAEAGVPLHP